MSSLTTCSNVHGISPSCLIQVVLVIRSNVCIVSLLHSRYHSFLFLQWSVTTTRPRPNGILTPVSPLYLFQRSENVLIPAGSTVCGRRHESSFLRLFLPPVRFSTVVLEHLPPSSVRPVDNTRTENLLPWLGLPRTMLYNLRVENPACRIPGTTLTMDWWSLAICV